MKRLWIALWCGVLVGCALTGGRSEPSPVVAEGEDLRITLEELDARVAEVLLAERTRGQETRLYELRAEVLEAYVEEQVLEREALRRGVDVETLLSEEAAPVGDAEVAAFFEANRARLPADTQLADVEPQIREHLEQQSADRARIALVEAAGVDVLLDPPRIEVAAEGPSLGPDDAPVTIIEFSDFECPYCRRALPVVKELHQRYPEQVRIVYRHLPLESIHPRARAAAEAASCAEEQGRFWAYHDRIFESPQALSDADLRGYAEEVGVDLEAWEACMEGDGQQAGIDADIAAARSAGISGTPAFVVNGILVTGVRPVEYFERLIERDLRANGNAP